MNYYYLQLLQLYFLPFLVQYSIIRTNQLPFVMDPAPKKMSRLNLNNQYSYFREDAKKKSNVLLGFSEQLSLMNKLPCIDKKYSKVTTRRVERQLQQMQQAIQDHKRRKILLSQHRPLKKKVMPLYLPMNYNMPNLQMSMCMSGIHHNHHNLNMSLCHQENCQSHNTPSPTNQNQNQSAPANQPSNPPQVKTQASPTQQKNQTVPQQVKKEDIVKKGKDINKFPQKSKINKFRVAAYVVYFTLYAKYFAKKFTQLRRNWFKQRYEINNGKIILEGSQKILRHLHEIDVYKMVLSAKQKVKQIDLDDAKVSNSKVPDSVLTLIHFVTLIIDYAREYMTNPSFILQHHEVFTVGLLTQNFMISNLYLPQQAAILHIHQQGYILVQEEIEVILLMIKIIGKIIVYNYLLGLKFSRQWNNKQQKSHGLDDSDMEELWSITRNAGIFLSIVCEQIYDKTYKQMLDKNRPYNFNEMSTKFNILPAKALEEAKRSKAAQNPNDSNSKLIINLQGYSDMQSLIATFPPLKKFKEKIKLKIIDFLTVIYTALKYEEAKVYDFIRYLTFQEKYLIMKGVKQDLINKKKKKKSKKKKDKQSKNGKGKGKGRNKNSNQKRGQNENSEDQQSDKQNQQRNRFDNGNGNGRDNGQNNEDDDSSDSENDSEDEKGKRKKKRLRFKHEQLFFDHKFDGHHKLQKLKQKMKKKV